jgi:hypothetical protein
MGNPKNREEGLENARRCWELRTQGMSHKDIAEAVGITRTAVIQALKRAQDEVRRTMGEEFEQQQSLRLAQLEVILREAMVGWRRSQRVEPCRWAPGSPAGEEPAADAGTREGPGDPRFLGRALEAMEQIRKLQGLDAPKGSAVTPRWDPQAILREYEGVDLDLL